MVVLELAATPVVKPMSTGRNHPLLLGCENAGGEVSQARGVGMFPEHILR